MEFNSFRAFAVFCEEHIFWYAGAFMSNSCFCLFLFYFILFYNTEEDDWDAIIKIYMTRLDASVEREQAVALCEEEWWRAFIYKNISYISLGQKRLFHSLLRCDTGSSSSTKIDRKQWCLKNSSNSSDIFCLLLFYRNIRTCTIMHEPISVLLLLPHTVHCKKKPL